MHIYAGDLLMTTGSYDDAAKAYSNSYDIGKLPQALYKRAKVLIAINIVLCGFINTR